MILQSPGWGWSKRSTYIKYIYVLFYPIFYISLKAMAIFTVYRVHWVEVTEKDSTEGQARSLLHETREENTVKISLYCNDSGYHTIKYDEQLGVDCLLVSDRLTVQAPWGRKQLVNMC